MTTDPGGSPLREGDTGAFGVLSERPNPDGLIVRHVFPFERTLRALEYERGAPLLPQECEAQRDLSRAIAVTRARDTAMRAAESGARKQTIDNHR